MKRKLLIVAAVLLLGSATISAQVPQMDMNQIGERITKELKLDEKQTADFMKEWKALFPAMDEQAEMPTMEEMQKKFENFDKKLKEILTEEQYNKYHEMMRNRGN